MGRREQGYSNVAFASPILSRGGIAISDASTHLCKILSGLAITQTYAILANDPANVQCSKLWIEASQR